MPSQGILHGLALNVSPANTQRLGVVPAFCEPGVVALHGTEAPRAWGGRMREAPGPDALVQGKGGCSESSRLFLETWLHIGRPQLHLQVAGGGTSGPTRASCMCVRCLS